MRKAIKLLVAEALILVIGIILFFGFVILSWYIVLPSIYTLVIWLGVFLIGYSFIAIIITLVMLGIAQIVELIRTRGKNSI